MESNKKNCVATIIIFVMLFAVPAFSTGRLKMEIDRLNSEIYEIDYRGPETHSYRPPPNRSGRGNTNVGSMQKPLEHARSKRTSTEIPRKIKVKKLHG